MLTCEDSNDASYRHRPLLAVNITMFIVGSEAWPLSGCAQLAHSFMTFLSLPLITACLAESWCVCPKIILHLLPASSPCWSSFCAHSWPSGLFLRNLTAFGLAAESASWGCALSNYTPSGFSHLFLFSCCKNSWPEETPNVWWSHSEKEKVGPQNLLLNPVEWRWGNIIIASKTKETSNQNTIKYLRFEWSKEQRNSLLGWKEALARVAVPTIRRQLHGFLQMTGFCWLWIPNFEIPI